MPIDVGEVQALRRRMRSSPCPGLFRIVATGDGGVCRIKTRCGQISAAQARVVAAAAARWGNGIIEATNRANLQIRGVRPVDEEALIAALLTAELGPGAGVACDLVGADDLRNVMINPAAGRDPRELIDCASIADELLSALAQGRHLHGLSPKTAILLDGGGPAVAVDHRHDLWLSAVVGADGRRLFAFGVSGSPCFDPPICLVPPREAVMVIVDCLGRYAAAANVIPALRRFRHWAVTFDRVGWAQMLGLEDATPLATPLRLKPDPASLIGIQAQRQPGLVMVGGVAALGRLTPASLAGLADLAERFSAGRLILTPWRGVLLPDVPPDQADAALAALTALGLATTAADPLAQMVACSGTGGCASARADTQGDGIALAAMLHAAGIAPDLHLTGCPKSCAAARVADATLAAVAPGRYDLHRRSAGDEGFGPRIAADLDLGTTAAAVTRLFGLVV